MDPWTPKLRWPPREPQPRLEAPLRRWWPLVAMMATAGTCVVAACTWIMTAHHF